MNWRKLALDLIVIFLVFSGISVWAWYYSS
jgi:hypothetical protein